MNKGFNRVVAINVGNEILSGKTVNTNLTFLGSRLFTLGVGISEALAIPDTREAIQNTLEYVWKDATLVICTGGLGPTADDITKNTIAEFFNKKLIFHERIYLEIKRRFALRNMEMPETNKVQAYIPEGFVDLENDFGTAPGLFFEEGNKCLFCLPGVPFEMEHLFDKYIVRFLKDKLLCADYYCKDLNTHGISESKIAELMKDVVAPDGVHIAWLPKPGRVDIRVYGRNMEGAEKLLNEINDLLTDKIWATDEKSPFDLLHRILIDNKLTVSTAESCTSGMIATMLSKKSGASQYFKGSIISYANEIKTELLSVSHETLDKYGAVSEETVREMLLGCEKSFKSDIVCAVSGIAGPNGGSPDKPVGTVYVGTKYKDNIFVERCLFTGNRDIIKLKATEWVAFNILKCFKEENK